MRRVGTLLTLLTSAVTVIGCASAHVTVDAAYFPPPPASARVVHLRSFNRLYDLIPRRRSLLEVLRNPVAGPRVGTPAGVAYRDGHLYLCDTDSNVVHDWNLIAGKAARIGGTGDVGLVKPVAVAVDKLGAVYVADSGRGEVVVYRLSENRAAQRIRPADVEHYKPVSLAVGEGKLYVGDIAAHRIDVFSTHDGMHVESFGGVGSGLGRFYFPMGVAVEGDERLLVSDMMNGRVQVFDAHHNSLHSSRGLRPARPSDPGNPYPPLFTIGRPGNRYGDMGKPRQLAVAPDGVIFVADAEFGHVHLFNKEGRLLMLLGGPGEHPGATPMPVGVAIAPTLPDHLAALVPVDFRAAYYVFVTNTVGTKRISLFAVGSMR